MKENRQGNQVKYHLNRPFPSQRWPQKNYFLQFRANFLHESNKKKEMYWLENSLPILSSKIIKNILDSLENW